MAQAVHTADQVRRFADGVVIADKFKLEWADPTDPAVVITWNCVCINKLRGSRILFTSVDCDEPEAEWELPNYTGYEGDFDPNNMPGDGDLAIHYHKMTLLPRVARKTMAQAKGRSMARSSVIAWKPATWKPLLAQGLVGRDLVCGELFRQLSVPERINQACFKELEDHECCTLGEVLLTYLDLMRVLPENIRETPEVDAVLQPVLMRLCEMQAGRGKKGEARTKAMTGVRKAFLQDAHRDDKVTQAMLGISGSTTGT